MYRAVFAIDVGLGILATIPIIYMLIDFESFIYRNVTPLPLDMVMGIIIIVLTLEATRRTVGLILPILTIFFLVYAYCGSYFPSPWAHGVLPSLDLMIGTLYMLVDPGGVFSLPTGVSATYIIMFTIFGAFLEFSGAGKFFVDLSLSAMGRKASGPGRAVTATAAMLGTVSGSGVAVTTTTGSIMYPLLQKAGYDRETAGGLLAAAGSCALITPPVLGAAAFIIAEVLAVPYLVVVKWSIVPAILYILSVLFVNEFYAKRKGIKEVPVEVPKLIVVLGKYGYLFLSLIVIIALIARGYTAALAAFWGIVAAFLASLVRKETRMGLRKVARALDAGTKGVVSVATSCICAGLVLGVVVWTGVGMKFSSLVIQMSGGNLVLALIYVAALTLILGMGLPATPSYIIGSALTAPAIIELGTPVFAAHMFVFYFAILSNVTPPVALAAYAAAAMTGANPIKTAIRATQFSLPTFLVPFMFALYPQGSVLLLEGTALDTSWRFALAVISVLALAAGSMGFMKRRMMIIERGLLIVAAIAMLHPFIYTDLIGIALVGVVVILQYAPHLLRRSAKT